MTNAFKMQKTKKNKLIEQLKNNLPNPKCFTQAFFLKTELFLLSLLLFILSTKIMQHIMEIVKYITMTLKEFKGVTGCPVQRTTYKNQEGVLNQRIEPSNKTDSFL